MPPRRQRKKKTSGATPGAPTPGAPTPGAPTPGAPTPGAPTPGAPKPQSTSTFNLPDPEDETIVEDSDIEDSDEKDDIIIESLRSQKKEPKTAPITAPTSPSKTKGDSSPVYSPVPPFLANINYPEQTHSPKNESETEQEIENWEEKKVEQDAAIAKIKIPDADKIILDQSVVIDMKHAIKLSSDYLNALDKQQSIQIGDRTAAMKKMEVCTSQLRYEFYKVRQEMKTQSKSSAKTMMTDLTNTLNTILKPLFNTLLKQLSTMEKAVTKEDARLKKEMTTLMKKLDYFTKEMVTCEKCIRENQRDIKEILSRTSLDVTAPLPNLPYLIHAGRFPAYKQKILDSILKRIEIPSGKRSTSKCNTCNIDIKIVHDDIELMKKSMDLKILPPFFYCPHVDSDGRVCAKNVLIGDWARDIYCSNECLMAGLGEVHKHEMHNTGLGEGQIPKIFQFPLKPTTNLIGYKRFDKYRAEIEKSKSSSITKKHTVSRDQSVPQPIHQGGGYHFTQQPNRPHQGGGYTQQPEQQSAWQSPRDLQGSSSWRVQSGYHPQDVRNIPQDQDQRQDHRDQRQDHRQDQRQEQRQLDRPPQPRRFNQSHQQQAQPPLKKQRNDPPSTRI